MLRISAHVHTLFNMKLPRPLCINRAFKLHGDGKGSAAFAVQATVHNTEKNNSSNSSATQAYEELIEVLDTYKGLLNESVCGSSGENAPLFYEDFSNELQENLYMSPTSCDRFYLMNNTDNFLPLTNSVRSFDWTNFSASLNSSHPLSDVPLSQLMKIIRSRDQRVLNSLPTSVQTIPKENLNSVSNNVLNTNHASVYMPFVASYDPSSLKENIYGTSSIDSDLNFDMEDHNPDDVHEISPVNKTEKKKKKTISKQVVVNQNGKDYYFSQNLKSYIEVCGNANMVQRAHDTLLYYRYKISMTKRKFGLLEVEVYNALLNCWAELGNLRRVREIFIYMEEDEIVPNLQSYAAYLECLFKCKDCDSSELLKDVQNIAQALKADEKDILDIFSKCEFSRDQSDCIEELLQSTISVVPSRSEYSCNTQYSCNLLKKLNDKEYKKSKLLSSINSKCVSKEDISVLTAKQMQLESEYFLKVKSIRNSAVVDKKTLRMRKCVKECTETFREELSSAVDVKLANLCDDMRVQRSMTLYPYLSVMDRDLLVNVLLQEIRFLSESAEYFSPNINVLCRNLGVRVMNYYYIWLKKRNKVTDKVSFMYKKYLEYLLTPELVSAYTPREYWQFLKRLHYKGPTVDIPEHGWPQHVLREVGKFLYDILLESASFDVKKLNEKSKTKMMVRPFYTTYERSRKQSAGNPNGKTSLQIRAHPKICKMYNDAQLEHLEFDVTMVPMVCPPRPWTSLEAGGLLMTSVPFIRFPLHANQKNTYYNRVPNNEFYPCFDSLNSLSICPWIINQPVLDLIINIFKNGGCEELDVPLNPESLPDAPKLKMSMCDAEKKKIRRQKAVMKKKKQETLGLWFDCLYKLSIANHFRNIIFWFPHNLDFRGRVYPTPPHFNHLGSDMIRSILLFAEGQPLGKNGLDWLKIHLINLTGFKKRESNHERLKYANEMMSEILDSAEKPFTGNQWWRKSDEPWQTLACCKEIAEAIKSPDPRNYISHLPVHQDGSCNGLQHYAALGRDELGAKKVNLLPSDCPQDVYSGVAALVEEERKRDAADGIEIAQILDGFIKRKVVKQTVMTVVYGVTEYGARQQILRQLQDIPDFPKEHCSLAALYLVKLTFLSIQKMFTATREIQRWFTDCAELITKISGKPVEWVTPLGLPVVQPYHKKIQIRSPSDFVAKGKSVFYSAGDDSSAYSSTYETSQLPNVRKQKNAFAPNFIHSLDSSHMMLTSLFCQRRGITFVSVHDCYWTHPATVEIMNMVCREQFVSLHSEPILESLSNCFLQKYVYNELSEQESKKNKQVGKLKEVLSRVPEKGTFDLKNVLKSVYFFS